VELRNSWFNLWWNLGEALVRRHRTPYRLGHVSLRLGVLASLLCSVEGRNLGAGVGALRP